MAATLTDPLIGRLVDGRYEVLSRIARGGMATVYLATDRRLDRQVALKVMHAHLADAGSDFVARFRREARAAARLTHPGLVAVYDQGVDGETSYLTMEYVEGTNLRRRLTEVASLTVGEALATTEAVLEALAVAHRGHLVHRDVKPENVLLATDGRVKLTDFGLARAVTEVSATTTGTVMGTVAYLAPELVARGASDVRTDVYAVGVMLYEMLTGRQPFRGATPIQVAYQHVHEDVPAPSEGLAWLPVEVDELVGALAARDPDDRPADAGAALDLLRRTRGELDRTTLARRADVAPAPERAEADADATALIDAPRGGAADDAPGRTIALPLVAGAVAAGQDDARSDVPDPVRGASERAWRRRVLAALVTVAVLATAGIAGLWWTTSGPGAYRAVPAGLVGSELATAQQVLAEAGLRADPTEVFHPEAAPGVVVDVAPREGDSVRHDGAVVLDVSKGPDLRTVPADLVGAPEDDVVAALQQAGFVVPEPTRAHSDDVPDGHVIAVSAAAGASLPVDSEVTLEVSDGPAPLTVTQVVGASAEEARRQLQEQGLVVEAREDFSEQYPAGTVMAQAPTAGTAGFRGDTVTITVSQGPPLVEVPDVVGRQFGEARATLEGLGFVVLREDVLGGFFGTVRTQDASPGSTIPKGSTIVLAVV